MALPRAIAPRLLLTAAAVLCAVLLALVVGVRATAGDAALAQLKQERNTLLVLLPLALDKASVPDAGPDLEATVTRLGQAGHLAWLAVLDREGRTLVSRGKPSPDLLPGETPLMKGGQAVAYIRFGLTQTPIAAAQQAALRNLLPALAVILGLGLFLFHLLGRWLTANLATLHKAVTEVQSGADAERALTSGPSEIAAIAREVNRLGQTLAERSDAARRSEARFRAVADYTFSAEGWFNPEGRLVWVSPSVERISGYTPLECLMHADLVELLVYEKDRKYARQLSTVAANGGPNSRMELRFQRKDGKLIWVELNWQSIHDSDGEYLGLRLSAEDIQARKEAELKLIDIVAELRREQGLKEFYLDRANLERARLSALLDAIDVGVMFVDQTRRIVYCNKLFNEALDLPEDEHLEGASDAALLERTKHLRVDDAAYREHIMQVLASPEASPPYDIALRSGRIISDASALVPGTQPGEILGRIWTYRDVTEQRHNAARLEQLATRDPLTGAYNRRRFHEELERMLADALRRQVGIGLLVIDLDGFKPINDEFGHQAGDIVLVRLADLVSRTIRRNEVFFRLGGDEFAVLATDSDTDSMEGLARRLGSIIGSLRFEFAGRETYLTASQGIALFPAHAADADSLVAAADRAMYRAKAAGKNTWALAEPHKPR